MDADVRGATAGLLDVHANDGGVPAHRAQEATSPIDGSEDGTRDRRWMQGHALASGTRRGFSAYAEN
jgi:hypothetical protein